MIIGKINDKILIDDAVLREPKILTRWQDPTIEEYQKEIERLNNNWQQAIEDLTKIANELGLEEGSTIYDILDKLKELKECITCGHKDIEENMYETQDGYYCDACKD